MGYYGVLSFTVLLGLTTPAWATATLHFTFGLTRQAEACWEEGDRIKYRVGGQTYEVAKAEVARIEGECSPGAPVNAAAASPSPTAPAEPEPTDAMLAAGRVTLPPLSWSPPHRGGCRARGVEVAVRRVIDGDTIEVRIPDGHTEVVRYIGMNSPEVHHPETGEEPGGRAARMVNETLLRGKRVELAFDVQHRDRHGRLLAYVFANGEHVNAVLVEQGYANASTYAPNVCYADRYRRLEREARDANRGLWGDSTSTAVMVANQDADEEQHTAPSGKYTSSPAAKAPINGPVQVRGYTRKDGTYVAPHTRSLPGTKGGTRR